MKKLEQAVSTLAGYIHQFEVSSPNVSKASVGWHIAHSYLVINSIVTALKKSNPSEYKWKFSLPHLYVLVTGGFPRGRGKAPERVIPLNDINSESLQALAAKTKMALAELPGFAKHAHFKHPYFGLLHKKSTIWFLEVHTKHHNKIIHDILNK
jgi:hypothetical protein